jgi:hypothetical protein
MATYTPGSDENYVTKITEIEDEIDLSFYVQRFLNIKNRLLNMPETKSSPDQETLDNWNNVVVPEAELDKDGLDNQAKALYEMLQPIKNAGLIPSKYDDDYQQLEDYVNSL